jgi:hypothetical protein
MTLKSEFEKMMKKAWPDVRLGTAQHLDLRNAYYGGALVMFAKMLSCRSTDEIHAVEAELQEHGRITQVRADIFSAIIKAAKGDSDDEHGRKVTTSGS